MEEHLILSSNTSSSIFISDQVKIFPKEPFVTNKFIKSDKIPSVEIKTFPIFSICPVLSLIIILGDREEIINLHIMAK